jgi:hypothetical protein
MDPVKQGQRAAWTLFAVALGVYVAAAILIGVTLDTSCRAQQNCVLHIFTRQIYLALVGAGIGFFGFVAATSKSQELPPESRRAFWLTGLVCMALSGLLWFSICAGMSWVLEIQIGKR